jgi:hypothetical protein
MRRSPRRRPQSKLSTEEAAWGLESSRRAQPKAEEEDPVQWWSRKNLAVVCKGMTRRAIPAPRKRHDHEGGGYTGPTVERRRRAQPECSNGIRD